MLSDYLNQTAEYRPHTGTDDRGQPTYGGPVSVPCRKQAKLQNVLTATGQLAAAQHVYYLDREVNEGDMLDGLTVMAVLIWSGLDGETIGYKAVM